MDLLQEKLIYLESVLKMIGLFFNLEGEESLGAGNDIQLGLSEKSNSYDYGMLDLDFGNLRVRYFNGYLETDSLFINRYITGRGIEWNNKKTSFCLSEVVIYSGKNRY